MDLKMHSLNHLRVTILILTLSALTQAQTDHPAIGSNSSSSSSDGSLITSTAAPSKPLVTAEPQPKIAPAGVLIGDKNIKYKVILAKGKLEHAIGTAALAGPIIALNTKVAAGAGALPVIFAAKGALLGSALAAPVIKGTALANIVATKVAGGIVFVPVALKTGIKLVAAKVLDVKKQAAVQSAIAAAKIKSAAAAVGLALLKPFAVLEGAKLKLLGKGSALVGKALKVHGAKMMATGAALKVAGAGMKGVGSKMVWWGFGGPKVVGALAAGAALKSKAIAGLPVVGKLGGSEFVAKS